MAISRSRVTSVEILFAVCLVLGLTAYTGAQGIGTSPYSPAGEVRRFASGTGLNATPIGSDTIPLSSDMLGCYLPRIPNLEFGFLYNFGTHFRSSRLSADYVFPWNVDKRSVVFGEAHGEFQDFWRRSSNSSVNRTDLSFGGGYRRMQTDSLLIGVNGFYDTSRIFNEWYSSGGVGAEMAATVDGDDAIDVNFNYYGNLFSRNGLVNAWRNKGGSFDVEAGYSRALLNHSLDLRLKVVGYQFDVGEKLSGWRGGADLTTRDGVFTLRYEHGHDRLNGSYNTVGGFVNVGFQLANVVKGESPFTMPEPVFQSPRNLLRLLTQKVKRNWHQPDAVVIYRSQVAASPGPTPKPKIANFRFAIGPQKPNSGTFTYNPDTAVWTLLTASSAPPVPCSANGYTAHVTATQFTISLTGDTSGLTFPVSFTATPIPSVSATTSVIINEVTGCASNSLNAPFTANLASAGAVYTGTGSIQNYGRPRVLLKGALPPPGTNIGTIIITANAPNNSLIAPLVVQIVSGP